MLVLRFISIALLVTSFSHITLSQYTDADGLDENEIEAPLNTDLKEFLVQRNWSDAIRRSNSHPEEAAQWDIGALFDNPRPKYTRYDPNKPDQRIQRIYTEADDDETLMEWVVGGQDMSSAWGNREMYETRMERRAKKGRWRRGYLAMHWAGMNQAPFQVVKALFVAYPDALQTQAIDGKLPIHCFMDRTVTADTVRFFLQNYPHSALVQANDGSTPLHVASKMHVDSSALDVLLEDKYNAAIKIQNKEGKLPLHVAAISGNRVAVAKLLEVYPDACKVRDGFGMLPLHAAASKRDPVIVQMILDAFTDGVFVADDNNMLPLHYVSMQGPFCNLELLRNIIGRNPDGASVQDINGMLPLHWLTMRGAKLDTLNVLLEANPKGGIVKDSWERTPMWIANKRRKDNERYDIVEQIEVAAGINED